MRLFDVLEGTEQPDAARGVRSRGRPNDEARRAKEAADEGRMCATRYSIIWSAAEKFFADDGWAIASYIGLTLLMSLFPFLIFVAAVAGFLGSAELAKEAAELIFAEWPDVVARPIAEEVANVLTAPRGGLLTLGAVLSFYFASSAIEALRVGLNRAYGLVEKRPWWLLRLQSLGLVLVGSLALLTLALPGRARPADRRRALGLVPVGRRGARLSDVRPHRRRGLHAGGCRCSLPISSCRPTGRGSSTSCPACR